MSVAPPTDPLATRRQGDLIKMPVLIELGESKGELVVHEVSSATGFVIIISQTCDIRREDYDEPWLQTAPVEVLTSEDEWRAAANGQTSVRRFALPASNGMTYPVADVRHVQSIRKSAVRGLRLELRQSGLNEAQRETFSAWLGRRLGRHAYPDALEKGVLRPLREVLVNRKASASPDGGVIRARDCILLRHNPPEVTVLFALDPILFGSENSLRGDMANADSGIKTIVNAIVKKNVFKNSGYRLTAQLKLADAMTLAERRGYHEVVLE